MGDIRIENVGPIDTLSIPLPKTGGVIVLAGRNGAGKTHALAATQALLRGSGKVPCRDGAARGTVDGCGARITVGRRTTRGGELGVDHIEGRLSVGEIIDPGLKDPAAADAKRIKAIVQVSGAEPDPSIFHDLFGGVESFVKIVPDDALATDDLVEMSARVKRAVEAQARAESSEAERLDGLAEGLEVAAGEMDGGIDIDTDTAQSELEAALREASAVDERVRVAAEQADNRREAEQRLAEIGEVPDLEAAKTAAETARRAVDEADEAVAVARAALESAENSREQARAGRDQREKDLETTARENRLYGELQKTLASDAARAPDEETINRAHAQVDRARARMTDASLSGRASAQRAEARERRDAAHEARERADRLRNAAAGVDVILSEAVNSERLQVQGGRLVVETDQGAVFYSRLSHGERARIAVDLAADRVGAGGLIPLAQEVWEGFDPDNRAAVAAHAKERGVVIVTAEATDGTLRASEFGAEVEG